MVKHIAWPPSLSRDVAGSWREPPPHPSPKGHKCISAWICVVHKRTQWGEKSSTWDPGPLRPQPPTWLTGLGCLAEPEKPWVRSLTLPNGDYRKEQGCLDRHISGLTCCKVGGNNIYLCFLPGQNIHRSPHLLFFLSHWGFAMTNWTMPASSCRLKMSSVHIFLTAFSVPVIALFIWAGYFSILCLHQFCCLGLSNLHNFLILCIPLQNTCSTILPQIQHLTSSKPYLVKLVMFSLFFYIHEGILDTFHLKCSGALATLSFMAQPQTWSEPSLQTKLTCKVVRLIQ